MILRCEYVKKNQLGWTDGFRWWPELIDIFPPTEGATIEFKVASTFRETFLSDDPSDRPIWMTDRDVRSINEAFEDFSFDESDEDESPALDYLREFCIAAQRAQSGDEDATRALPYLAKRAVEKA